MQIKMYPDWPNLLGRKQAFVGTGSGPASYVAGGDPVTLAGYNSYLDYLISGSVSVSGTYYLRCIPNATGPRATWKAIWISISTGLEPAAATNLSAEVVDIAGFASGT